MSWKLILLLSAILSGLTGAITNAEAMIACEDASASVVPPKLKGNEDQHLSYNSDSYYHNDDDDSPVSGDYPIDNTPSHSTVMGTSSPDNSNHGSSSVDDDSIPQVSKAPHDDYGQSADNGPPQNHSSSSSSHSNGGDLDAGDYPVPSFPSPSHSPAPSSSSSSSSSGSVIIEKPVKKLPVCLFLHGAMIQGTRPTSWKSYSGEVVGALKTYWGFFNDWYADICEEFIYSWAQTVDYSWEDEHLQSSYYEKSVEVTQRGGIVFADSMANGVLAGACYMQNKCVQWYSIGGGYSGHAAANVVLQVLKEAPILKGFLNDVVFKGFDIYAEGMRFSKKNPNAMAKVVDQKKLLKGALCGTSAKGSPPSLEFFDTILHGTLMKWKDQDRAFKVENAKDQNTLSLAMQTLGDLVSLELFFAGERDMRNDGIVEVSSCAYYHEEGGIKGQKRWYGTGTEEWPQVGLTSDPKDPYLLAPINHGEQCGVYPTTPLIHRWIRNMMCREIEAKGDARCPPVSIPIELPTPRGRPGDTCGVFSHRKCQENATCKLHSSLNWMCKAN